MIETVSFCGTIYTKTMDIGGFNSLAYTLNHLNTWTPFDIAHAFTNNGTSTLRNTLSGERPTTTKPKQTHSHSSICVLQCAREAQQQAVIACFQTYTQLQIHHIFRIFLANREIHSLTHSLVFGHGIQSHYCSLFRSSHCAMHAFNGILTQCNGDIPLLLLLLLILLLLLLLSHTLKWMYIRNSVFPLFYRRTFTVAFANRLIFRVLLFHRNFSTAIRIECMLNFEPNDPSTFNTPKPREKCSSTHTYTHIHIDGTGNVKETWGERESKASQHAYTIQMTANRNVPKGKNRFSSLRYRLMFEIAIPMFSYQSFNFTAFGSTKSPIEMLFEIFPSKKNQFISIAKVSLHHEFSLHFHHQILGWMLIQNQTKRKIAQFLNCSYIWSNSVFPFLSILKIFVFFLLACDLSGLTPNGVRYTNETNCYRFRNGTANTVTHHTKKNDENIYRMCFVCRVRAIVRVFSRLT